MARELALFPLQIVVFPGEAVNLHIFEPRYRQLVKDCEDTGITFGIPSFQNGRVNEFGTEVRLLDVKKTYPDGKMDVNTEGMGVFRIKEFYPKLGDKLYSGGLVRDYPHEETENLLVNEQILEQTRVLFEVMNITKKLPDTAVSFSTYDIAHYVGFNPQQEYDFLMTFSAAARQQMLLEQIQQVIPVVKEMENLRDRARMNGHFKNLIPPEF